MNDFTPVKGAEKQVCILMGTFQGGEYLLEQLDSIRAQTYRHWKLFVSDDGSTDDTLRILLDFQASLPDGQVNIFSGPRRGFAANFLSLVLNQSVDGDYFAFCDQDDIWVADKLEIALSKIHSLAELTKKPIVYGAATLLVGDDLGELGKSHMSRPIPSFKNALAQNIAGGNTIVFDKRMRELLLRVGDVNIVSHDWWIYLINTGVDGVYFFDENPKVLYRQHSRNLVGANSSYAAKLKRVRELVQGRYRRWMDINLKALDRARPILDEKNVAVMEQLMSLRKMSFPFRVLNLYRSGIHRQSWMGNLGLYFACMVKLI